MLAVQLLVATFTLALIIAAHVVLTELEILDRAELARASTTGPNRDR